MWLRQKRLLSLFVLLSCLASLVGAQDTTSLQRMSTVGLLQSLKSELEASKMELAQSKQALIEAQTNLTASKESIEQLQTKLVDLEAKLSSLETKLLDTENKLTASNNSLTMVSEELKAVSQELSLLKQELTIVLELSKKLALDLVNEKTAHQVTQVIAVILGVAVLVETIILISKANQ
jgi:septal ring factor EnvC (AmiA/AmiB activator)